MDAVHCHCVGRDGWGVTLVMVPWIGDLNGTWAALGSSGVGVLEAWYAFGVDRRGGVSVRLWVRKGIDVG